MALGLPAEQVDPEKVLEILNVANTCELVDALSAGVHTQIDERGARLSGGQRPRLGLTRALYTDPKLLILDEGTSALYSKTEFLKSRALDELQSEPTLIIAAQRFARIFRIDRVFYLEGSRSPAEGTLHDVRQAVPKFDQQARLMEL